MKKLLFLSFMSVFVFLFSGCGKYQEALKVLPNELAVADECVNKNKVLEKNCYDLIAYKNSFAQLRLGVLAQLKGEYKEAFQRYSIAKKSGNFYSNALLSDLYNKGLGVKKDKEKVLDLLNDSSSVDPMAAYKLGSYYIGKRNYDKGLKLLTFAAKGNLKKAQYALYKIYSEGKITKINEELSKKWFLEYQNKSNRFINKIYGV